MSGNRYVMGIDFGTLSARAMVFDTADGSLLGQAEYAYPHSVMEDALPDGMPLPPDYALQCPGDYLLALEETVCGVLRKTGVRPERIAGIGVDFTSCTVLPVRADGTPVCDLPQFRSEPHAYCKLWKHHAAKRYAKRMTAAADLAECAWLPACGGGISPEWMLPKLMQVYCEAPEVFNAASQIVEAGDWIVWRLTGQLRRNAAAAGFVANWRPDTGYPSEQFLDSVQAGFGAAAMGKLAGVPVLPGTKAGGLLPEMARQLGLIAGTPIAVAHMDSQSSLAALGIHATGSMLAIMGTSTVYLALGDQERAVPGIGCVVRDGIIPGFFGYSAGQSCVGDCFAWAANICAPKAYEEEAARLRISMQELLTGKAARQMPGEHGLLALDWFNGNRSILLDMDLSGCVLGLTLHTKPEDIYRALIEATAYGARVIVENFRAHGVPVDRFYTTGGIARKNALAMQLYADILGMPVFVGDSENGPALGAGILGAVAGGVYGDIAEASMHMGRVCPEPFLPDPNARAVYEALYQEYVRLHDWFGRGGNPVMHRLKALREAAAQKGHA